MTRLIARTNVPRRPRLVSLALLVDRCLYLACELLGRTTNPLLLGTLLAGAIYNQLAGRSVSIPLLPHLD